MGSANGQFGLAEPGRTGWQNIGWQNVLILPSTLGVPYKGWLNGPINEAIASTCPCIFKKKASKERHSWKFHSTSLYDGHLILRSIVDSYTHGSLFAWCYNWPNSHIHPLVSLITSYQGIRLQDLEASQGLHLLYGRSLSSKVALCRISPSY